MKIILREKRQVVNFQTGLVGTFSKCKARVSA